jgi:phenylacetic acid degradation protein
VIRALSRDEIDWKRKGTAIYQRLALEAQDKLRAVAPLTEVEPNRRRAEAPAYDPLILERAKFSERP